MSAKGCIGGGGHTWRLRRALVVLSLGISVFFATRRSSAFRSGADTSELRSTVRVRWQSNTINFELHDELPSGVNNQELQSAVLDAMNTWSSPSCSTVRFSLEGYTPEHAQPGDGKNTIEWLTGGWSARGFQADAAGVTDVQYQKSPNGDWVIVEADMYLNADQHTWTARGGGDDVERDVQSVVTHEAGHMLGLMHPCEPGGGAGVPDCTSRSDFSLTAMYPIYSPTQSVLSDDDVAGVCFLYPLDGCEQITCASDELCVAGSCVAKCGHAVCADDEVCEADRCVTACDGTPCVSSTACSKDVDCAAGLRCLAGKCEAVSGTGEPGDPCAKSLDCAGLVCDAAGYCGVGLPKLPFGAECQEADDCIGNQCIRGAEETPVCTRSCMGSHAACPGDWQCRTVDNRPVCAPPANQYASGGCAFRPSSNVGGSPRKFALVLLALAGLKRRRRRQAGWFVRVRRYRFEEECNSGTSS